MWTVFERVQGRCQRGKPQVAYRETFRRPAKANTKFARQSGGHGQYGHCVVEFEPQEPGKGFEFESKIVGGVVPKEFIPPIEAGIKEAMENGTLAGFPVVDIKATLVDGSYHEVDSSEWPLRLPVLWHLKKQLQKLRPFYWNLYLNWRSLFPKNIWVTSLRYQ